MISVSLPFRGAAPGRETWVLEQWVNFDPLRWKRLLPDGSVWPQELDRCPRGKKWPYVDRATVLAIGERATNPVGAAKAYVASAVWGTGTGARSVDRRVRVLRESPHDVAERLADAVTLMLGEGPVAAYDFLHGAGNMIKDLGPSFGTKVLYFTGYGRTSHSRKPLILDQYVAAAVNRLCGTSWPKSQWPAAQYADYLDLVHGWATEWHCEEDVVERVLFSVGKAPSLAIGALSGRPAG